MSAEVRQFPGQTGGNVDNGGRPPDDGDMENRVEKLEKAVEDIREDVRSIDIRLSKMETRLDHMATKADLHETSNAQIKWTVGTAIALGAVAITVITFVLNNAAPKAAAPQQQPIIITVPAQAPVAK